MTDNQIRHELNTMPLPRLKDYFCEHFNVSHMCLDLMDELSDTRLRRFMKEKFLYEFSISQLEDIFSN